MFPWSFVLQRGVKLKPRVHPWIQLQKNLVLTPGSSRLIYISAKQRAAKRKKPTPVKKMINNENRYRKEMLGKKKELEARSFKVKKFASKLQKYIAALDHKKKEEKAAEELDLDGPARDKEIDILEEYISLPESDTLQLPENSPLTAKSSSAPFLPKQIVDRVGTAIVEVSSKDINKQNWGTVIKALYYGDGLAGLGTADVDKLILNIPLEQRSGLMSIINEMMMDSNIVPSKLTYDLIMAAYAHRGHTIVVEAFFEELKERGFKPDNFTYGHLLKSLGKNNDLENSSQVLREMQQNGINPSYKVTTTLLQTCIRVGDYKQAFDIFDMLKFLSSETQPDLRIYNSLLLAAAKQNRIEKVLDLYKEMTTRAIDPLEPNSETYNTLVYACAKDERTHVQAWHYLLEMQSKRYVADRKAMQSLLYLCGTTGEVMFSRALFKQLCTNNVTYPDAFMLNSLFVAYANYKPGNVSPVMASALGPKIRSSFFSQHDVTNDKDPDRRPPFLPVVLLSTKEQVLAESQAIFAFFKNYHPEIIVEKSIYGFLNVALKQGDIEEFKKRFDSETYCDIPQTESKADITVSDSTTSMASLLSTSAVPRNKYLYDLAIAAAVEGKDLIFGGQVWEERGRWRRTQDFRKLSPQKRKEADFHFAQKMVGLLAVCGETEDALKIIKSTLKQFEWRKHHVPLLIEQAIRLDDTTLQDNISSILKFYKRRHEAFSEFYEQHNLHNSRSQIN